MTCKDCIHFDACENMSAMRMHLPTIAYQIVDNCVAFKDKSKFIELPCKVGNTVYMFNRDQTKVQKMVFEQPDIRCHCAKDDEFACCMPICNDHNGICAYRFNTDFSEIGKTVFLAREEAEKALKEREKNE